MLGIPGALATRRRLGFHFTRGTDELPFVYCESFAGEFAGEQELGSGSELLGYPGLVEPGGADVAALVAYFDAHHAQAAFAEGSGLGALDLNGDGRGFAWLEVPQLTDPQIAMAAGDPVEEVTDGLDSRLRSGFRRFRTDPLEGAEADLEDAGAGPVDGGAEQVRAGRFSDPGEGAHYWAASSHHQLGWPPSWVSTSTPSGTWVSISSRAIGAPSPAITVTISASAARC